MLNCGLRFVVRSSDDDKTYNNHTEPESLQYGLRSSMEEVYRLDERVEAGMSIMSTRRDQER